MRSSERYLVNIAGLHFTNGRAQIDQTNQESSVRFGILLKAGGASWCKGTLQARSI